MRIIFILKRLILFVFDTFYQANFIRADRLKMERYSFDLSRSLNFFFNLKTSNLLYIYIYVSRPCGRVV